MFGIEAQPSISSFARRARLTSGVASLIAHAVLFGVVLAISRTATGHAPIRAPVRITYFSPGTLLVSPALTAAPVPLGLPDLSSAPLAPRPTTVPVSPAPTLAQGGEVATDPIPAPSGGLVEAQVAPSAAPLQAPISVKPGSANTPAQAPPNPAPVAVAAVPTTQSAPPKAAERPGPEPTRTGGEAAAPVTTVTPKAQESVASVVPAPATGEAKAPPVPSSNQIVVLNSSMPSPRRTKLPSPNYPPMARSQRITGEVIVAVTVDTTGQVTDAEVISSPSPLLNGEALKAAKQLRYEPYLINGVPVRFKVTQAFKFGLN